MSVFDGITHVCNGEFIGDHPPSAGGLAAIELINDQDRSSASLRRRRWSGARKLVVQINGVRAPNFHALPPAKPPKQDSLSGRNVSQVRREYFFVDKRRQMSLDASGMVSGDPRDYKISFRSQQGLDALSTGK